MDLHLPFEDYYFARSRNGLICFHSWHNDNCGPTYICNPIAREYIMLPRYERWYWWTGFGYTHSTNEYKVVQICEFGEDSNLGSVQVYTIGSGTGRRNAGKIDINMSDVRKGAGVFVNGDLNWVNYYQQTILVFHLTDEKFCELLSPYSG
ncbi:uncharacterized protein LOC113315514 [Papaver somniferum]|uniref:uncharacterized protein LOC113315514 n=1 Tax=Papaver somniferum TaxID=3469 RepID=UPI000E6F9E6E|nr:uncharacterized protein LOC113315514 [Papaver somniferum]